MPQPTLKQLFAASNTKGAADTSLNVHSTATATASGKADAGADASADRTPGVHEALKENRPTAAAAAAAGGSSQGRRPALQHGAPKPSSQQQQPRSTQLFLDLGQRNFGASRCSVCGMVYTKGHEEDEKLHKAYHQGAVQGFKFQGWPQERVLLSEVAQGRLLMVLQSDPASHVKKVRQLCAYLEKAHGMAPGWLLSVQHARVFLYVSSQRRVVGLAVVEPLKQAYRVLAPAGSQEQEVDSVASTPQPTQQQQQRRQQAGGPSIQEAAAAMPQQQQQQQPVHKREPQQLLWPGLRKRGRLAALGRAAGSAGNMLSDPSLHTASEGPGCSLKADSCPTSLLAAAGRMQVQAASSGGVPAGKVAAGAATEAAVGAGSQEGAGVALSQPQQQGHVDSFAPRQQQQQQVQPEALPSSQAMPPPPPQQQRMVPGQQRGAAASIHSGGGGGPAVFGATGTDAAAGSSMWPGGLRAAAAAARADGDSGGRSLLIDQRKATRAMLGVRMVWVSPEQRRTGVATKLLDAARCNMVPGYVVPCAQVAFSQPTGDGVALAAAFARTEQFLVYGIEP